MPGRPPLQSGGETLPRRERLLRRADYLRCYRRGLRHHGSLVVLYVAGCEEAPGRAAGSTAAEGDQRPDLSRLGITVSRKVGGSVERHRIKRRIKEIYRRWPERRRLPNVDLMVHVKPAARQAGFEELRVELDRLFRRALLFRRLQRGDRPARRGRAR